MTSLLDKLSQVVGKANILTHESDCARFNVDERGGLGSALAVVRPADSAQVSRCVQIAKHHDCGIVAQGGRSGLVGSGIADGHLVISLERLAGDIDIDPVNRSASVGAGSLLSHVNETAAVFGLTLPIDLGADPSIGGMVAANTGGARLMRYGGMRQNLLGLEVVIPDAHGSILKFGKGLWKDNSALDLKHLFVSSSGSLGIITRVDLALQPLPESRLTAMMALEDESISLDLLGACERYFGPVLSAFEGISNEALEMVRARVERVKVPFADLPFSYAILIELTPPPCLEIEKLIEDLYRLIEPFLEKEILDIVVDDGEDLWAVRHAVPEALRHSGSVIACDIALRRGDVLMFRKEARQRIKGRWPELLIADFGHIGDGGLHFNMVNPDQAPLDRLIYESVRDTVHALVEKNFHGSFSAEHGVGPRNIKYYEAFTDPRIKGLSGRIQDIFAPEGFGRVDFGMRNTTRTE